MKNSIQYWTTDSNAPADWRYETLDAEYGDKGIANLWRLHCYMAAEDDCKINLNTKGRKINLANKLRLSPSELDKFLHFLTVDCELIQNVGNLITTKQIQETLRTTNKKREKNRLWMQGSRAGKSDTGSDQSERGQPQDDHNSNVDDKNCTVLNCTEKNYTERKTPPPVKKNLDKVKKQALRNKVQELFLQNGGTEKMIERYFNKYKKYPDVLESGKVKNYILRWKEIDEKKNEPKLYVAYDASGNPVLTDKQMVH